MHHGLFKGCRLPADCAETQLILIEPKMKAEGFKRVSLFFALISMVAGADLSPGQWPKVDRGALENLEEQVMPQTARLLETRNGMIAATMSPVSVRAGLETLKQGGTAADAASVVALTQVSRALGSYVSYAGIFQALYFEKKTGKITSIDSGWSTYRNERDFKGIPGVSDLVSRQGRKTLVPGFMAGIEAMQRRFGVLQFKDLFAPAIWYAENGVRVSPMLSGSIDRRKAVLERTPEGRTFLCQSKGREPQQGEMFFQPELATTLRAVAEHGAKYMYDGPWAEKYVEIICREGGLATLEDLHGYQPLVQEPLSAEFAGNILYVPGAKSAGGAQLLLALNLIQEAHLISKPPYWESPESFKEFAHVSRLFDLPQTWVVSHAHAKGIELNLEDMTAPYYAKRLLEEVFPAPKNEPASAHTNCVVVVDHFGNIAVVIHSINTVEWGSTGIVVGGIPIADAASVNQYRMVGMTPGDRVPDDLAPCIAIKEGKPVFAIGSIGFAHRRETARILMGATRSRPT